MSKPRSTTEQSSRKAISEALLADRLGLNEPWIERWEENGIWREESSAPTELPRFICEKLQKGEIKDAQHRIDQLVAAGCQKAVIYFCLEQLSPAAEWIRSGGQDKVARAKASGYEFQEQKKPIARREDLALVASKARAARKQIHKHKRELCLMFDAVTDLLPRGISTATESPEDALLLLDASLSWVTRLADSYVAPMETTLMKSKGLLYLTLYVFTHADKSRLRSPKINSVLKDNKKATYSSLARRAVEAPGNVLAELISRVSLDQWPTADLKEKVASFKRDHPRLYKLLEQRLTELHTLAGRGIPLAIGSPSKTVSQVDLVKPSAPNNL